MVNMQALFSDEELKQLELRAERVAIPIQDADKSGRIAVLITMINSERYAIPIDSIVSVYDDVAIVPIPGVPNFVAGIANVRGHIITVLNLGCLLGIKGDEANGGAVLVSESEATSIGLCVESIGDAAELPISQLNTTPTNLNLDHPEYIQGIFHDGTALLNIQAVLADSRLIIDEAAL